MPRKRLPDIRNILGFDPLHDRVERHGKRVFIVSDNGHAPVEVRPDEITKFPTFCDYVATEFDVVALQHHARQIGMYALMSIEGRQERLHAIQQRIAVLTGQLSFVVETPAPSTWTGTDQRNIEG